MPPSPASIAAPIRRDRYVVSEERWRDILGFEGYYQVSNKGRIRSTPRQGTRGGILKPSLRNHHLMVRLYINGQVTRKSVHRLVAEAFIGPCPPGQEVRHGPAGACDNSEENLCYGTHKENVEDTLRDGTRPLGSNVLTAKLTETQVAEIIAKPANLTDSAVAREYGVGRTTVNDIRRGASWKHLPRPRHPGAPQHVDRTVDVTVD